MLQWNWRSKEEWFNSRDYWGENLTLCNHSSPSIVLWVISLFLTDNQLIYSTWMHLNSLNVVTWLVLICNLMQGYHLDVILNNSSEFFMLLRIPNHLISCHQLRLSFFSLYQFSLSSLFSILHLVLTPSLQ